MSRQNSRKIVHSTFPTEYLTPQELSIIGTLSEEQLANPYRPLAFSTCPIGPNSVRILNDKRQIQFALELKIIQAGLELPHNLYMRLQRLNSDGRTQADPVFMGPRQDEQGKIVLVENEVLTDYVYSRLEEFGGLVVPRRSVEGHGPNPERG